MSDKGYLSCQEREEQPLQVEEIASIDTQANVPTRVPDLQTKNPSSMSSADLLHARTIDASTIYMQARNL